MNFSQPHTRTKLHSRRIECDGYLRDDGLWDIEARLVDTRYHETPLLSGKILQPGGVLHEMGLRVTLDDSMTIIAVQCILEQGPTNECPQAANAYQQLIGLRIGAGFSGTVKKLFRGSCGCTHLTELLIPLATTAMQTFFSNYNSRPAPEPGSLEAPGSSGASPVNICYGFRSSGEVARIYMPEQYDGDSGE